MHTTIPKMVAGLLLGLVTTAPALADEAPPEAPKAPSGEDERVGIYTELALFPMFTQRQIEGPNRDDRLVDDGGLSTLLTVTYAPLEWLEAGIYLHFDVGSTRAAKFSRPDAQGETVETDVVEGSYWELWTVLIARARYGPAFLELGWAPLMLREDDVRDDLPNASGEIDGVFVGSRSVAFLLGIGGRVPLAERLDLTLRLEFRIRYLVERGGEALADEEEFGQMALWPYVGLGYAF